MTGTPCSMKGYIHEKTITFIASGTALEFIQCVCYPTENLAKDDSVFQIVVLTHDKYLPNNLITLANLLHYLFETQSTTQ